MRTLLALLLAALCVVGPARALEISLEENRAQRGNIGYVDIQKIFQLYPETKKTKQSFAEIVHQAEEQVNLKKADILALRGEIAKLNLEHDLLMKTPISAAAGPELPAPSTGPLPAATTSAAQLPAESKAALPTIALATATASVTSVPAASVSLPSTGPAAGMERSDYSQLPGMSHAHAQQPSHTTPLPAPWATSAAPQSSSGTSRSPLVVDIPGSPAAPPAIQSPPSVPAGNLSGSTAPVSVAVARATAPQQVPSSGVGAAPNTDPAQRRNTRLKQLEDQIAAKIEELARKEAEFKDYQAQVEKNLTNVESRRSEMLLAQIYNAVREVARDNGVSVIVDKSQIMFGGDTVDLTDKVIKKLQESQP